MKNRNLPFVLAALLAGTGLASCGSNPDNMWQYSRDDMSTFLELYGTIKTTDENTVRFTIEQGDPLFTSEIGQKDIKVFNLSNALNDLSKEGSKEKYLSYDVIKKNLLKVKDIKTNEDLNGFQVDIQRGEKAASYGVLISKNVTINNYFAICSQIVNESSGFYTDPQLDFEEKYIDGEFTWEDGGKFMVEILTNVGTIAGGMAFATPTAVVSGIFGILNSIGNQFCASGPTSADIMKKLDEMDKKLDQISEKLDANHEQLLEETIRTQAMVSETLLKQYESEMTSFTTDYEVPLQNYSRDFADYLEQSYKSFIKDDEIVKMYLEKNSKGQWKLMTIPEEVPASQELVTININNFDNSEAFLQKSNNIVRAGFMDEFNKDIEKALSTMSLPAGLSKEDAKAFAHANIVDHFTKQYYLDNHSKALELRNDFINYAKRISGRLSTSIVNSYINRMKLTYNFAKEMKNPTIDLLSNMLGNLDQYAVMAAQACTYAETNDDEVASEYKLARQFIKNAKKTVKDTPDNYSFIENNKIQGAFYQAKYVTWHTDKGNHPTFHASFELKNVNGGWSYKYNDDSNERHSWLNSTEHLKISTRWNLMKQIGIAEDQDYVKYLSSCGVIPQDSLTTYDALLSRQWISNDGYRIYTGITQLRDLNDSDKSLQLTCQDAGNPDGDYFSVGKTYNFRSKKSSSHWSGKIAETTYIDAITGRINTSTKKVAAYARYSEGHWYWIDDERWSFVDNPVGNYFFGFEYAN